jgi:hypothetical protein
MQNTGMKLLVTNPEQTDSVTGVRWCLEKSLRDQLRDVPDLFVLLVTLDPSGNEMERQVLPLEQIMTYVQFQRAGNNTLFAAIVHPSIYSNAKRVSKILLKEFRPGFYEHRTIERHERTFRPDWINEEIDGVVCVAWCELNVIVPKELFAKEPPAWLSAWVNKFAGSKPRDRCVFRKRMLFAFTLQPILMAVWAIMCPPLRLFWWVLGVFFGMRDLRFSPVFHPFRKYFDDIWSGHPFSSDSVFMCDKDGNDRSLWFILVYPPFLTVLGLGLTVIAETLGAATLLVAFLLLPTSLGVIVVAVIMISWLSQLSGKVEVVSLKRRVQAARLLHQEKLKFQQKSMELLGCESEPRTIDLHGIPRQHRTVWLRFQSLKAKVCRPFAG